MKYLYLFMHPSGAQLEEFCQWSLDGKVRPVIDKTFPLNKVVDAMTYLESNRATGKVIVEVRRCLLHLAAFLVCCTACVPLLLRLLSSGPIQFWFVGVQVAKDEVDDGLADHLGKVLAMADAERKAEGGGLGLA